MKRFFYKLLVVAFLMNLSPVKELMKAPLFLLHYWEHQQEFADITLQQFYIMHYVADIHFDEDYEHDRQLPFKSLDYSPIPVFLVSKTLYLSELQYVTFLHKNLEVNKTYRFLIKDPHIRGIFHPPQSV